MQGNAMKDPNRRWTVETKRLTQQFYSKQLLKKI